MRSVEIRKALAAYEAEERDPACELDAYAEEQFGLESWAVTLRRVARRPRAGHFTTWSLFDEEAGRMYDSRRRGRIKRKAWKR